MNRNDDIARLFNDWLLRKAPPREFANNPKAAQAEAEALAKVLLRMAPNAGYVEFVNEALDALDQQMKTRFWPNANELGAACSNMKKERYRKGNFQNNLDVDMSDEAITARKMQRGEPVGEGWLYGRQACILIATGMIDEPTMAAYRSGAFLARREAFGQDAALTWEAEAKERHQEAKIIRRQTMQPNRNTAAPNMRADRGVAA